MTLEILDRTIFELLRIKTVGLGYLPNIPGLVGTNAEKNTAYLSAKDAIRATGKEVIEIKSVGSGQARGEMLVNTITIDRISMLNGEIGGFGVSHVYQNTDGNFSEFSLSDVSTDVTYQIRAFSKTTKYERIMHNIVFGTLGRMRSHNALVFDSFESDFNNDFNNDFGGVSQFSGESIFLLFDGAVNVSSADVIEWLFTVRVQDVWLFESQIVEDIITPMTTARLETFVKSEHGESTLAIETISQ